MREEARAGATVGPGHNILLVSDSGMDSAAIVDAIGLRLPAAAVHFGRSRDEALRVADRTPDTALVLLADHILRLAGSGYLAALRTALPTARLAVFGTVGAREAGEWVREGVDGVLSRRLDPERFANALLFLLQGNCYASPDLFDHRSNGKDCRGRGCGDGGCGDGGCGDRGCAAFPGSCAWHLPLLDRLPVMLMLVREGVVVYANRPALQGMRRDGAEVVNRRFSTLFAPDQAQRVEAALAAAQGPEPPPPMLLARPQPDGGARWLEIRWSRSEIDGAPGLSCVCLDVTEAVSDGDGTVKGAGEGSAANGFARRFAPPHRRPDRQQAPASGPVADGGDPDRMRRLTARQREVLSLLARGRTNKQIARQLGIAEATVKLHVHHILRTLRLTNRTEAALAGRHLLSTS